MKMLIVGSGAAGGLIGARLIENKCEVTFLVRPARKAQLLTTGLALYSHFGKFRRPVYAITLDELRGVYDLIVIACRAQDYEATLATVAPSIGVETTVLPVIEGASHLQPDLVPNGGRHIGGMLEARIALDADGVLHQRLPVPEVAEDPRACSAHLPTYRGEGQGKWQGHGRSKPTHEDDDFRCLFLGDRRRSRCR